MTSPFAPEEQKPGGLIKAADWNAAMEEVVRLKSAKVNRQGADTLEGPLTIKGALTLANSVNIVADPQNADTKLAVTGNITLEINGSAKIATKDKTGKGLDVSGTSRLGGHIDYQDDTVLSVAPGTIHFDAPGSVGARLTIIGKTDEATGVTAGNVGINTTAPTEKLQIGDFSQSDNHIKISTAGGHKYRAGIKLKIYDDNNGFTIENDEREIIHGLNFLRHHHDSAGKTALFIAKDNGNVGIYNTAPLSKLTINQKITHDGGFSTFGEAALTIFDPNHNGGNSPNGTRDILHLVREGVGGQAYGNKVSLALGRYENNAVKSRTQLDIKLTDDNFSSHNKIMTLRSNGNVGIGTDNPQGFHINLPEKNRGSKPSPGISMAGGTTGNASIELRNNGSGSPYIDFSQSSTVDRDARIILTATDKLEIQEVSQLEIAATVTAKAFVGNGAVVTGMILMWSGTTSNIPAGWKLCDGGHGTPDLRDRFIVGAGQAYKVKESGGANTVRLGIAHLPSHDHSNGAFNQLMLSDGKRTLKGSTDDTSGEPNLVSCGQIKLVGSNQPHENRPPYYALAYIMKVEL
ncbi:hypothetical protein [Adonisia turfae]|nr:hypothetical protein [Adonisia turfae]